MNINKFLLTLVAVSFAIPAFAGNTMSAVKESAVVVKDAAKTDITDGYTCVREIAHEHPEATRNAMIAVGSALAMMYLYNKLKPKKKKYWEL